MRTSHLAPRTSHLAPCTLHLWVFVIAGRTDYSVGTRLVDLDIIGSRKMRDQSSSIHYCPLRLSTESRRVKAIAATQAWAWAWAFAELSRESCIPTCHVNDE